MNESKNSSIPYNPLDALKQEINLRHRIMQYKKLHKIVSHSRAIFNYYFNLDSKALASYKLDEGLKRNLMRSTDSTVLHRRKIDTDDLNIIK